MSLPLPSSSMYSTNSALKVWLRDVASSTNSLLASEGIRTVVDRGLPRFDLLVFHALVLI